MLNAQVKLQYVIYIVVLAVIVTAASVRYAFPKVQTKIQQVEVTKEVVRNNVQTVIKTVEKPDGSKETTTTIDDTSIKAGTQASSDTKQINIQPQWMISGSASLKANYTGPVYGVQVQRRILGPFYLGVKAESDKSIGALVGFEF